MLSHNAAHLFELMSSDIWQFHSHAATITMTKKIRLWGSNTPTGPIVFASVRCNILPCCLGISLPCHTTSHMSIMNLTFKSSSLSQPGPASHWSPSDVPILTAPLHQILQLGDLLVAMCHPSGGMPPHCRKSGGLGLHE